MSIFDLSESVANTMHNISNIIVLFVSIGAVIGTVGLFWSGGVKNKYEKINELKTQERIMVANKNAAEANERAIMACVQDQLWNNVYSGKLKCPTPRNE